MKSKDFYKSSAWRWFSKLVLLEHSNNGVCTCATCGVMKSANDKLMHLGHMIKVFESGGKTNFNTAFDTRNVMPQCYKCNVKMGGNELKMRDAIEDKYGKGVYDELKIKARTPFKLTKPVMQIVAERSKEDFNKLVKIKGNPWKKS